MEKSVEISELIDSRKLSGLQVWTILICALVVLFDGYDIQTMALVIPTLMKEWGLQRPAFTLAVSISLFGMFFGASIVGPFGDRFGRKPVMIIGMLIVGVSSYFTAHSETVNDLVLWRGLTGLGLGMSLPNATALTSEYVPYKQRAWLISLMYCNVAVGALAAGFAAPFLISNFGWKVVFYVGGVLPLLLVILLITSIPESLKLLLAQRPNDKRIPKLIERIAPGVDPQSVYTSDDTHKKTQSVFSLFTKEYAARSLLLWILFVLNLSVLYTLISWLPSILADAGWSQGDSLRGSVMIQAGGVVGGLVVAFCSDRKLTVPALFVAYLVAGAAFAGFLFVESSVRNWDLLLLAVGAGVSGGQLAFTALAALFYPPTIRATGTGWAFAMGRFGAFLGPNVAAWVIATFHLPPVQQLLILIPFVVACALCVLLVPRVWNQNA